MSAGRVGVVFALALVAVSCSGTEPQPSSSASAESSKGGRVDVGGFELAWECRGEGGPTVILDAGLNTAGTSEWFEFLPLLGVVDTRVCTYDPAGTGTSDARQQQGPSAETQATELHALLDGAGIESPYVLVPPSYAGLVARVYADRYPSDVAGFVFEDVSTAWEIDLWPRWDDSPLIDGGQ